MKDFQPTSLGSWFYFYQKLTTIEGLEYLDTSKVTNFKRFLRGAGLTGVLDLSTFDTSSATDMTEMFQQMGKVTTIYVGALWSTNNVKSSGNMFYSCAKLVGGAGTEYSADHVTADYAHIDSLEDPGYFTSSTLPPTISSVEVSYITDSSARVLVEGKDLKGGKICIAVYKGEELVFSTELSDFGICDLTDLDASTTYTVKVSATNKDGTTSADPVDFTTLAPPAKEWSYDPDAETISWGGWTFRATVNGTEMSVGAVTAWPDGVLPLDFSLPVAGGYTIVSLDPQFGKLVSYKPEGVSPQCERVGTLTLPGEGLRTVGIAAFAGCANAVGLVSFPSTLTTLNHSSFADCDLLQIDGSTIPVGVTQIPQYCFRGDKAMFGDVVLTNVTLVSDSAFQETAITSATFGLGLTRIDGNYKRGAFQDCKSLTNLVFDAASKVRIVSTFTFQNCTALKEMDLRGVVDFSVDVNDGDRSHISGCSKLKKIIFGAGLTNLTYNAMAGADALKEVIFEGLPPERFEMPYLSATNSKGHAAGYDNQSITTYVHRKLVNEKNEAGMCWADYAANGQIGAARKDPARNTTWAAEYVYEGVDLAKRQLLTIEPGTGLMLLVR